MSHETGGGTDGGRILSRPPIFQQQESLEPWLRGARHVPVGDKRHAPAAFLNGVICEPVGFWIRSGCDGLSGSGRSSWSRGGRQIGTIAARHLPSSSLQHPSRERLGGSFLDAVLFYSLVAPPCPSVSGIDRALQSIHTLRSSELIFSRHLSDFRNKSRASSLASMHSGTVESVIVRKRVKKMTDQPRSRSGHQVFAVFVMKWKRSPCPGHHSNFIGCAPCAHKTN